VDQEVKARRKKIMNIPTDDWTLPQLATFCVNSLRRSAEDAYHIGAALKIARDKQQAAGSNWLAWLEENVGISRATAYRYIDVATRLTAEDCEGRPLGEVYALIERRRSEQAVEPPPSRPEPPCGSKRETNGSNGGKGEDERPGTSHAEKAPSKRRFVKVKRTGGGGDNPSVPPDEPTAAPPWAVPNEDAVGYTAESFASALAGFLDGGDIHFLEGDERQALAEKLARVLLLVPEEDGDGVAGHFDHFPDAELRAADQLAPHVPHAASPATSTHVPPLRVNGGTTTVQPTMVAAFGRVGNYRRRPVQPLPVRGRGRLLRNGGGGPTEVAVVGPRVDVDFLEQERHIVRLIGPQSVHV
jgi:hypothetical protein